MPRWMWVFYLSFSFASSDIYPVQWNTFAYSDKAQEEKRLVAGAAAATALDNEREKRRADRAEKKKLNSAWSEKVGRREEKEKRREKKGRKKKWLKTQVEALPGSGEDAGGLKRGRSEDLDEDDGDDWEELAKEERMAKKVRKGDVSQSTFDAEFVF